MNTSICAIATGRGGAIGIIRVSGDDAIDITSKIFKSRGNASLCDKKAYTLTYGTICDGDNVIDEVMVAVYRAPHSYTGENSTEIMCHGSQYILESVLRLLIENGCESAAPGEFTRRAFLNGKMDLSQAEAVADLIASTGKASHDIAMGQLRGNFTSSLAVLREQLLKMTSLVELELDFSDQDVTFADRKELIDLAGEISSRISSLASSFATGKAVKDGVPVAIIGKTNVGKSTLLNQLVHDDRAIVSDIHGTTRDVIEDTADINGVTFRFIDTAGIRNTDDTIEQLGIDRTYSMIEKAAIVLWIMDSAPTPSEIADIESRTKGKHLIKVRNKIDITSEDFNAEADSKSNDCHADVNSKSNDYNADANSKPNDCYANANNKSNDCYADANNKSNDCYADINNKSNDCYADINNKSNDCHADADRKSKDCYADINSKPNNYNADANSKSNNCYADINSKPNNYNADANSKSNNCYADINSKPNNYNADADRKYNDCYADANNKSNDCYADINISAKYSSNITNLENLIYKAADIPEIRENDVIVTNARHYDALLRAHDSITRVTEGLNNALPGDLLSEDLRDCIHILGEIVGGEINAPEVLNNIFKNFCVGK